MKPEERGIVCLTFDCLHKNVALGDDQKKLRLKETFEGTVEKKADPQTKEHAMSRGIL